jgi:hypothetical protein
VLESFGSFYRKSGARRGMDVSAVDVILTAHLSDLSMARFEVHLMML